MKPAIQEHSIPRIWLHAYFGLTLVFGFLLFWLLFGETEFATAAKLIFLAVFILTLKRWTGAVLFVFCQLQLLFLEPASSTAFFSFDALMWSGLSLGMLVVVSRYRTLQDRDTVVAHRSFFSTAREAINGNQPDVDAAQMSEVFRQLTKCVATLLLCSMVAWGILDWFPTGGSLSGFSSIREYRLTPNGYRLLICSISLFCGFFVAWLLVNELCWRKLNARQSRIYLHSVLLKFLYRDFRSVTKRRLKRRLKRRRKQAKSSHNNGDIPIID